MGHPLTPSMRSALSGNWLVLALRGLLTLLFGIAALLLPLDTPAAVGRLFGAYAIAEGVLVASIGIREARYRAAFIAEGAFGVVAGLAALAWPDLTARVLVYVLAAWALLSGVAAIVGAVLLRGEMEGEWFLFLVGILSVVLGAAMVLRPGVGLTSLVWLVGLYALVASVALIVLALKVRGIGDGEAPRGFGRRR